MYGRLGGMYFLHLTEANAQRRRLAEADRDPGPGAHIHSRSRGSDLGGFAMFVRLLCVMGAGLAAIALLAAMVG